MTRREDFAPGLWDHLWKMCDDYGPAGVRHALDRVVDAACAVDDPAPVWRTLTFGDLRVGDVVKLGENWPEETVQQVRTPGTGDGCFRRVITDASVLVRRVEDLVLVRHPRPEVEA